MKIATSGDVFYPREDILTISDVNLQDLVARTAESTKGRARICAHFSPQDALHEMFIVLACGTYIRPHMHPAKCESFHMIKGEVDIVLFDNDGQVVQLVQLSKSRTSSPFYYRLSKPYFHTVICRSEYAVFHEVTQGPFEKSQTKYPEWAPEERDVDLVSSYLRDLDLIISAWPKS